MDTAPQEPSTYPYTVTVHRPDLPDIHLGLNYSHQAQQATWALTDDLRHTHHVNGTTIDWAPTPDGVTPEPPVPATVEAVADLMVRTDDNQPAGHGFPDLYSRLKAQEGYETASRIWRAACALLDYEAEV